MCIGRAVYPKTAKGVQEFYGKTSSTIAAIGGTAALIGKCVKKAEIVTYEDLGSEAIRRLEVEDLPIVVVIDSEGNNLYEQGQKAYLESIK